MRFKAKDLIRILNAVDGDSDVVFHVDNDDNQCYSADSATIKEGMFVDGDGYEETELTLHFGLYYSGTYDSRLLEKAQIDIEEYMKYKTALTRNNGDRKAAARDLGVSDRTMYRKLKQYNLMD